MKAPLKAKQVMTNQVQTVNSNEPLMNTLKTMTNNGVRHLPVENDSGELVGVISRGALGEQFGEYTMNEIKDMKTEDVMIHDVVTADPETPMSDALRTIVEKKIGCLPVIQDKKVVGIITACDTSKMAKELLDYAESV